MVAEDQLASERQVGLEPDRWRGRDAVRRVLHGRCRRARRIPRGGEVHGAGRGWRRRRGCRGVAAPADQPGDHEQDHEGHQGEGERRAQARPDGVPHHASVTCGPRVEVADNAEAVGQDGPMEARGAALERAHHHADAWLASLDDRAVPPSIDADEVVRRLGELPDAPTPAAEVVDLLAEACEPGLVAIPSGRFFGMVIGGALPAALGADWLTSAWDQNIGLRALTPAAAAVEEVAGRWVLDLLGLPGESAVGFVTGATMANFTCLATARDTVLTRVGHDIRRGLLGGPRVRVLVGAERHPAVDLPLRFLGLGAPDVVPVDAAGPDPARRPGVRARAGRRAGHRRPAGGQHPLRRLRPVRGVRRGRPRARRLGARGRRLRAVGGRVAAVGRRRARAGGRRLVGDRRPQDAQRPLRLRARDRARPGRAGVVDGDARRLPDRRRPATRRSASPSSPGAPAGSPRGRRCAASAAAGSSRWSKDWPPTPAPSPRGRSRSPASRCSTTWSSPRSA